MKLSGVNRIVGDVLGVITIIAIYFVGGVIISTLAGTSLITNSSVNTSVNGQITNYGTVGSIIGLVMIVLLLRDAVTTVRGMGHGGGEE